MHTYHNGLAALPPSPVVMVVMMLVRVRAIIQLWSIGSKWWNTTSRLQVGAVRQQMQSSSTK
jgi:hypothetical protein